MNPRDLSRGDPSERAWRLLDRGDADGARALAESLVTERPDDPEVLLLAGSAAADTGDLEAAERYLAHALERDPLSVDARVALADVLFTSCQFSAASRETVRLKRESPDDARVHWLAALLAEREGNLADANREERAANRLDAERFPLNPRVSRDRFESLVADAMKELPPAFEERLENLAVLIEPVPGEELLEQIEDPAPDILGLYVGIPATERSSDMFATPPDAIYLFQRNLERVARDERELAREIRTTLLHEIGHYLGMDEDDLSEAGYE